MIRYLVYEALCYHCAYTQDNFCLVGKDCKGCRMCDKDGVCFCLKEKPDEELTCPCFKYRYLRG